MKVYKNYHCSLVFSDCVCFYIFLYLKNLQLTKKWKWGLGDQNQVSSELEVVKNRGYNAGFCNKCCGIKSLLNFSVAPFSWMEYLTSPSLLFLICKVGLMVPLMVVIRNQWYNVWKARVWLFTLELAVHQRAGGALQRQTTSAWILLPQARCQAFQGAGELEYGREEQGLARLAASQAEDVSTAAGLEHIQSMLGQDDARSGEMVVM